MNCAEASIWISAYLDGELDPETALAVAGHLETCDGCRGEFEALSSVDGMMRALPREDLPSGFAAAVAASALAGRKAVVSFAPSGAFGRLMRFFETFFNLLGLEVSLATRALDEFDDVPSSFIGYAYFKVY